MLFRNYEIFVMPHRIYVTANNYFITTGATFYRFTNISIADHVIPTNFVVADNLFMLALIKPSTAYENCTNREGEYKKQLQCNECLIDCLQLKYIRMFLP